MKLKLRNFAKIEEADIIIDGITVIARENNTGKSTIGTVLSRINSKLIYNSLETNKPKDLF